MTKPIFLSYTTENVKNAHEDQLFLKLEDMAEEGGKTAISLEVVDKNNKQIRSGQLIIITQFPNGQVQFIKPSGINLQLPIITDHRSEVYLLSQHELAQVSIERKMEALLSLYSKIRPQSSDKEEIKH
jgi:hypothetical protein